MYWYAAGLLPTEGMRGADSGLQIFTKTPGPTRRAVQTLQLSN